MCLCFLMFFKCTCLKNSINMAAFYAVKCNIFNLNNGFELNLFCDLDDTDIIYIEDVSNTNNLYFEI